MIEVVLLEDFSFIQPNEPDVCTPFLIILLTEKYLKVFGIFCIHRSCMSFITDSQIQPKTRDCFLDHCYILIDSEIPDYGSANLSFVSGIKLRYQPLGQI